MSSRDHMPRSVVPDVPGHPPDVLAPAVTSELEQGLGSQQLVAATSRETRLAYVSQIDERIGELAAKWFEPAARIAIFIIYFWFGILKAVNLSPATPLASALTAHTIGMQYFSVSFHALAVYECVVGILILIPAMTRITFVLIIIHMGIVSSPLVIVANVAWTHPMVPTLEGQYIIKDLAIIALAIGLLAQTRSRRRE
jgi:uncharacterized membrane protein YkgB